MEGYIEKSLPVQAQELEKINQYTRSSFDSDSLYVFSAVLCNNDIDRDYEKFSVDTLRQLKDLFVGRTGIFDHSMKAADQKARIFETSLECMDGRTTADGEELYVLRAKAYMLKNEENMPLITEIEAGIKKELSVSCSVERSLCSVCGKDKRSADCGHIAGRVYDGKQAYTVLDGAKDAYEFSFVAVPAQREAGVTKAFDFISEGKHMTDIIKNLKTCKDSLVLTAEQAGALAQQLETLSEEAQLGREYKKSLAGEVVALCAKAVPSMDIAVFSNVASVMTTRELLAFKTAFAKASPADGAALQIKNSTAKSNVNQFKI